MGFFHLLLKHLILAIVGGRAFGQEMALRFDPVFVVPVFLNLLTECVDK